MKGSYSTDISTRVKCHAANKIRWHYTIHGSLHDKRGQVKWSHLRTRHEVPRCARYVRTRKLAPLGRLFRSCGTEPPCPSPTRRAPSREGEDTEWEKGDKGGGGVTDGQGGESLRLIRDVSILPGEIRECSVCFDGSFDASLSSQLAGKAITLHPLFSLRFSHLPFLYPS